MIDGFLKPSVPHPLCCGFLVFSFFFCTAIFLDDAPLWQVLMTRRSLLIPVRRELEFNKQVITLNLRMRRFLRPIKVLSPL